MTKKKDETLTKSQALIYEEMLILGKTIRKIKSKRNKSVA